MKLICATTLTVLVSMCFIPCAAAKSKDAQQAPTVREARGILERAKATALHRKFVTQLKTRYLGEQVNAEWAETFQKDLYQSFQQVGPEQKGELTQVACRQSLCAVDITFVFHDEFVLSQPELMKWLSAASQPCGFHILGAADEQSKEKLVQRIYLECNETERKVPLLGDIPFP
jgi:hypothetical protein